MHYLYLYPRRARMLAAGSKHPPSVPQVIVNATTGNIFEADSCQKEPASLCIPGLTEVGKIPDKKLVYFERHKGSHSRLSRVSKEDILQQMIENDLTESEFANVKEAYKLKYDEPLDRSVIVPIGATYVQQIHHV